MNATFALLFALVPSLAPGTVFVTPDQASSMIEAGAVVIDARNAPSAPYLPGARPLSWWGLRDGIGRTGRLAATNDLVEAAEAAGVRDDRAVLVYGDAREGWGEDARIWWMLAYLGHREVRLLDGGIAEWRAAGKPTVASLVKSPARGKLTAKIVSTLRADHQRVDQTRRLPNAQILDARNRDEYEGATPYLSARGGHIPGATLATWSALMDERGRVLPQAALRARLAALTSAASSDAKLERGRTDQVRSERGASGASEARSAVVLERGRTDQVRSERGASGASEARSAVVLELDRPIIAYCTGGVRSAFVVAALREAGFTNVANYDGSWWDWASRLDLPVSLDVTRPGEPAPSPRQPATNESGP